MIIRRVNSQIESGGATGKNSPDPDRAVKISEITAEDDGLGEKLEQHVEPTGSS